MTERMESIVCISVLLRTHKCSYSVTDSHSFCVALTQLVFGQGLTEFTAVFRAVNGGEAE